MGIRSTWAVLGLFPIVVLVGCGHLEAPPDMESPVYHRTSGDRTELDRAAAKDLADKLVPFARVANRVYCGHLQADAPDQAKSEKCDKFPALKVTGWTLLFESQDLLNADEKASGLQFMAFGRLPKEPPGARGEIIIGFRGTDATSLADWRANLRWITRFLPLPGKDQYEIVHARATGLVDRALAKARESIEGASAASFDIYTTGHSLGGGLAQLLAYSDHRIQGAVVFDPSPVTGYSTLVTDKQVSCSARVLRVYERGEGLAYLRSFLRRFYTLSDNIEEVSFDFIHTGGNPFANHSMVKFREGIEAKAETDVNAARPVRVLPGQPDCDCYRLRRPDFRPSADLVVAMRLPPWESAARMYVAPATPDDSEYSTVLVRSDLPVTDATGGG